MYKEKQAKDIAGSVTDVEQEITKEEKQRSAAQNRALHKFFEMLCKDLTDSGLDMKRTLKPSVEIPWTAITVKEYLWKPIQDAMLEKESTTELSTKEVNTVYETLIRHLGEKFGITTEFPNIEDKVE